MLTRVWCAGETTSAIEANINYLWVDRGAWDADDNINRIDTLWSATQISEFEALSTDVGMYADT